MEDTDSRSTILMVSANLARCNRCGTPAAVGVEGVGVPSSAAGDGALDGIDLASASRSEAMDLTCGGHGSVSISKTFLHSFTVSEPMQLTLSTLCDIV